MSSMSAMGLLATTHSHTSISAQTPPPAFKSSRLKRNCLLAASFFGLAAIPSFADPISVSFTASQVAGSEWHYSYSLAGSFIAGDDLAIYFPQATSSSLTAGNTADPDFTSFVLQPDPLLPADGELDLVAGVSNPSLTGPFSANFLYSGAGSPGAQSFAVFDSSFNQIASGTSTLATTSTPVMTGAPVPEPGSFALLGSGALTLWHIRRRRL